MTRFRRWMALPMGLTALALAWLAWRVGGNLFALACIALAAALVLALWFAGRRQRRGRAVGIAVAAGLMLIVVAGFAVLPGLTSSTDARQAEAGITGAVTFSEARLSQARAAGKPVFVWMTADWCITCKVNEQAAIEREATAAAFRRAGVVVLRGDWTRRDPGITRFLTANGAAGVPFYLWVPAGGGAPERLPQVLTVAMLVDRAAAAD